MKKCIFYKHSTVWKKELIFENFNMGNKYNSGYNNIFSGSRYFNLNFTFLDNRQLMLFWYQFHALAKNIYLKKCNVSFIDTREDVQLFINNIIYLLGNVINKNHTILTNRSWELYSFQESDWVLPELLIIFSIRDNSRVIKQALRHNVCVVCVGGTNIINNDNIYRIMNGMSSPQSIELYIAYFLKYLQRVYKKKY